MEFNVRRRKHFPKAKECTETFQGRLLVVTELAQTHAHMRWHFSLVVWPKWSYCTGLSSWQAGATGQDPIAWWANEYQQHSWPILSAKFTLGISAFEGPFRVGLSRPSSQKRSLWTGKADCFWDYSSEETRILVLVSCLKLWDLHLTKLDGKCSVLALEFRSLCLWTPSSSKDLGSLGADFVTGIDDGPML